MISSGARPGAGAAAPGAVAEVGQRAQVQGDGTLKVGIKTVRLYGIHIPLAQRTCRTGLRPTRCGLRAALELDRKINSFVFCDEVQKLRDGSVSAICRVRSRSPTFGPREDLGLYLVRNGWAVPDRSGQVSRDDEELARKGRLGMWKYSK